MKGTLESIFNEVYEAQADALFRYCLFLTRDRNRALDASQETFVRFFEYLKSGKKVDYPKAFLFRAAKNFVIDQSRKRKADSLEAMNEEGFEAPSMRASDDIAHLAATRDQLKSLEQKYPDAYELVALRHAYHLSIAELATLYDTTENAMSVRIHRALATLQQSTND